MRLSTYKIVVIPGDGIGPELIDAAVRVLTALQESGGGFRLDLEYHEAGAAFYRKAGVAMSEETLEACRQAGSVLKGPVGHPDVRTPEGTEAGNLGGILRTGLDLYANVRPIVLWPGIKAPIRANPGDIDYVIVRENTEGLYASRNLGVGNDWAMSDTMLMTRPGVERIVRFAFELAGKRKGAPRDGVRRVTCVDKSNVLRSFAFFRRIFDEVGEQYPDVQRDYLYSDAAAQALVMAPDRFDVLVMENFVGDLLSDLGGGTVGGVGMCPSSNLGDQYSYFEPIHGSAPDIAGRKVANPLSQILSAAMMLEWLGEPEGRERIYSAVWRALESGQLVIQANGCPEDGTDAAAEAVVRNL